MSAAAIARPRLLRRSVSDAQRQASRRNGARSCGPRTPAGKAHSSRNARKHGFYAKLHLFTPEQAAALRDKTQVFVEAFHLADPRALALIKQLAFLHFQIRRIEQIEAYFPVRTPSDLFAYVRLICSLGAIEAHYSKLVFRCLRSLRPFQEEKRTNEPGSLSKTNETMASFSGPAPSSPAAPGAFLRHFASTFPLRREAIPRTWGRPGGSGAYNDRLHL